MPEPKSNSEIYPQFCRKSLEREEREHETESKGSSMPFHSVILHRDLFCSSYNSKPHWTKTKFFKPAGEEHCRTNSNTKLTSIVAQNNRDSNTVAVITKAPSLVSGGNRSSNSPALLAIGPSPESYHQHDSLPASADYFRIHDEHMLSIAAFLVEFSETAVEHLPHHVFAADNSSTCSSWELASDSPDQLSDDCMEDGEKMSTTISSTISLLAEALVDFSVGRTGTWPRFNGENNDNCSVTSALLQGPIVHHKLDKNRENGLSDTNILLTDALRHFSLGDILDSNEAGVVDGSGPLAYLSIQPSGECETGSRDSYVTENDDVIPINFPPLPLEYWGMTEYDCSRETLDLKHNSEETVRDESNTESEYFLSSEEAVRKWQIFDFFVDEVRALVRESGKYCQPGQPVTHLDSYLFTPLEHEAIEALAYLFGYRNGTESVGKGDTSCTCSDGRMTGNSCTCDGRMTGNSCTSDGSMTDNSSASDGSMSEEDEEVDVETISFYSTKNNLDDSDTIDSDLSEPSSISSPILSSPEQQFDNFRHKKFRHRSNLAQR